MANIRFVKASKEMDIWCIQKHLSGISMTPDIFSRMQRIQGDEDNQIRDNMPVVLSHHNHDHEKTNDEPNIIDKPPSPSSEKSESPKLRRSERRTIEHHEGVQTRRMMKIAVLEKAAERKSPAKVFETPNNVRRPKRKVTENITYVQTRSLKKKK